MPKEAIKQGLGYEGDPALIDTDRIVPKAEGGEYDAGNVRLLDPVAHMERHGNLRIRPEDMEHLKAVFDDRTQVMKLEFKISNQLLAYERRTDHKHERTASFLEAQLAEVADRRHVIDLELKRLIRALAKTDPITAAVLSVPGAGEITAAALAVYVDLEKAPHASSLWKYVGLHKPSHRRYELDPGEKAVKGRGGNKTLRTALYNTMCSMWSMTDRCAYWIVGDRTKARLEASEKVVESRKLNPRTNRWTIVEVPWKDTEAGHRDGAARRAMAKHFLADYWYVGREIMGLPTRPLYVQEQLGHTGIISPRERGWEW